MPRSWASTKKPSIIFRLPLTAGQITNFPGRHKYLIGEYYEKLADTGAIEQAEANALAKAAYKAVFENYPDSYWAEQAKQRMERIIYWEANQ